MLTIRKEVQDLINEIRGADGHEGEPVEIKLHHIIREAADVVAASVAAVDENNRPQDLDLLDKELREILEAIIQKATLGPAVRRAAIAVLPWVTPQIVEAVANPAVDVVVWLQTVASPKLVEVIETLNVLNNSFFGKPQE